MIYIKEQKGFTLVELLVGMAVMTLVMVGIIQILGVSIKSYQLSQKRVYEVQQSRTAINSVIDDLRRATSISSPSKGNIQSSITYTLDSTTYTVELGTGPNLGRLVKNSTPFTTNIVKSISFERDSTDGRIIKVSVTLFSPENNSSGDFVIDTVVFASNLTI